MTSNDSKPAHVSEAATLRAPRTKRRAVLLAGFGALLAGLLPGWPRRALSAERAVTGLRGPFSLVSGLGGNVLVRATAEGQTLIDSGAPGETRALVEALESLPGGGRVDTVINTHWHLDQIGGNETFGARGATIVAHEKTRFRLTHGYYLRDEDRYREPVPTAARPTETLRDRRTLELGGENVEIGYLIEAHTDGDVYVHFTDADIIAVGDAVSPLVDPELDWFGGGWLGGRVDSLARLLEIGDDATLYVPSYGPAVRRKDVAVEHEMMLTLFERTTELLRQGYSAAEMLDAGVMDDLARRFDDPGKFLYDVHQSLWAHHNKISHDIV